MKFYLDTSIWMDIYEDRKGYRGESLSDSALALLQKIISENHILIITDILIKELGDHYTLQEVNGMLAPFHVVEKIISTAKQWQEAKKIAIHREVPRPDALHAILARDHNLILISRDRHFRQLTDITEHYKPEDII